MELAFRVNKQNRSIHKGKKKSKAWDYINI